MTEILDEPYCNILHCHIYTKLRTIFTRSKSSAPFIMQQIYFIDQVNPPPFIIQQTKAKNENLASNRTVEELVMLYSCNH